ncbi:MAG: serine/threonine protein kinase [Deltaproteobacteria bacterium]|nr:serine/threonine protein kinase [Deltaproteobacteria bacterium]
MSRDFPAAFGEYVLLTRLGAGSAAEAFLARPKDPRLPKLLVIKRLHGFSDDSEREARFRHEADLATRIESPFLPRVYDVGAVDEVPYFALDYFEGWTIHRIMAELESTKRTATVASAVRVAADVLSGLAALHDSGLGVVHRDVSPKNVILGTDGRSRLIDLGIGWSKLKDFETATGAVLGSPGYMAPEQVRAEPVDARTDLYAVGILLWELLTLQDFITRGPLHAMLLASSSPTYRPARSLRPEVPEALDRAVARALSPHPDARFPSAQAMRKVLELAIESPSETVVGALVDDALMGEQNTERTKLDRLADEATEVRAAGKTRVYARRPELEHAAENPELEPTVGERPSRRPSREAGFSEEQTTDTFATPDAVGPIELVATSVPRTLPPALEASVERRRSDGSFWWAIGLGVVPAGVAIGLWFGRPQTAVEAPSVEMTEVAVEAPELSPADAVESGVAGPEPTRALEPAKALEQPARAPQEPANVLEPTRPEPAHAAAPEAVNQSRSPSPKLEEARRRSAKGRPEPPKRKKAEAVRADPKAPPAKPSPAAKQTPVPDVKAVLARAHAERRRRLEGTPGRVEADRIASELLRWTDRQDDAEERLRRLDRSLAKLEAEREP